MLEQPAQSSPEDARVQALLPRSEINKKYSVMSQSINRAGIHETVKPCFCLWLSMSLQVVSGCLSFTCRYLMYSSATHFWLWLEQGDCNLHKRPWQAINYIKAQLRNFSPTFEIKGFSCFVYPKCGVMTPSGTRNFKLTFDSPVTVYLCCLLLQVHGFWKSLQRHTPWREWTNRF